MHDEPLRCSQVHPSAWLHSYHHLDDLLFTRIPSSPLDCTTCCHSTLRVDISTNIFRPSTTFLSDENLPATYECPSSPICLAVGGAGRAILVNLATAKATAASLLYSSQLALSCFTGIKADRRWRPRLVIQPTPTSSLCPSKVSKARLSRREHQGKSTLRLFTPHLLCSQC